MNPVFLFTMLGPVIGGIGWLIEIHWLFWAGVILAGFNLFMNLSSGVMKLPILPILFVVAGGALLKSWLVGAGTGLLIWTAIEAVGELIGIKTKRRL